MKAAVIRFPGSNCDQDCVLALREFGVETDFVWHKDESLAGYDLIALPGGFSYGDYLRAGAIAGRSPVVEALPGFVARGGFVLGSCNGFQILCEAGLLPGALVRNECLQYRCQSTYLVVDNVETSFTRAMRPGQVLKMPISHGEGRYYAEPEVLRQLHDGGQIVFRYCTEDGRVTKEANPNGSLQNIAGVVNEGGTVLGLMPHPERAAEAALGGTDGTLIFHSLLGSLVEDGSFLKS